MENIKEKKFVSAVVYCHNDADTIGCFIQQLDKTLATNFFKYEIIVVNDFSSDPSVDILKNYAAGKVEFILSIVNMSICWGLEYAMNTGINLSIGDFIFEFDNPNADFDWNLMMKVYYKSLEGFDIVSAASNDKNAFKHRLFYKFFNRYAGLRYPIGQSTFRVLSRRAINRVYSITKTVPCRKIAYAKSGLAIAELKYEPIIKGVYNKHNTELRNAVTSFILFTNIGYKFTLNLSAFILLCVVIGGIFSLYFSIITGNIYSLVNLALFVAFCFAGMLAIMSIIVCYLKTITDIVFKKKDSLFESIEKLSNQ